MATVTYLTNASNETYSDAAFDYIRVQKEKITGVASILGISAGAIAGAMAEENTAYSVSDKALDLYATLPRTQAQWQVYYNAAIVFEGKPGPYDKGMNPALIDAGPANFKIATAIDLVVKYASTYPTLELTGYLNDYNKLVSDLVNPDSALTAKLYGLYMKEVGEKYFKGKSAYAGQWDSLPQTFRDALLVTFTNIGEKGLENLRKEPYEPQPALKTGGGMNHLRNAATIGSALGLSGYGSDVIGVGDFASQAMVSGSAGLAARYALTQLRYVVIEGIDYSTKNANGELDLYDPATGQGAITYMYISNRTAMLGLVVQSFLSDKKTFISTASPDTWAYTDVASKANITVVNPNSTQTHQVYFGDINSNKFTGGTAEDYLYGGGGVDTLLGGAGDDYIEGNQGDDKLTGGRGNDTLNGGEGVDTYVYNVGDGNDIIVDSDKKGRIFITRNVSEFIAINQFYSTGTSNVWTDSTGKVRLVHNSTWNIVFEDGGTINLGANFQSGDFGIHLEDAPTTPTTSTTIVGDLTPIDYDSSKAGVQMQLDANGNVKCSTVAMPGRSDYLNDGAGNERIEGGGGNDFIYQGKGDDRVLGGDGRDGIGVKDGELSGNDIVEDGNLRGRTCFIALSAVPC